MGFWLQKGFDGVMVLLTKHRGLHPLLTGRGRLDLGVFEGGADAGTAADGRTGRGIALQWTQPHVHVLILS